MNIVEESTWEGRQVTVVWRDNTFTLPRELVTQASGVCFTAEGEGVLVSTNGATWQLVGGHPEVGESLEAALIREVAEEACATITDTAILDWRTPRILDVILQAALSCERGSP